MCKHCVIYEHNCGKTANGRLAKLVQADTLCKECVRFISAQLNS